MKKIAILDSIQRALAGRQDLVVLPFIVVAIGAMVLPITPEIADFLIVVNISTSVIMLLVAFYIRSPIEFSVLPALVLILTVFRMAISIASTRLILVEAHGGQIIQTFGDFVIAGNVVVGLVVFLIITIVQFVVITKGSERVAEVAARFSLDGMPGKQMSIDSDLRSGDIDQAEARRRRQVLERETQLYGAMDGAMKFVKGDAIAGIIIVAVNLFGGMAIGTMQRGLTMSESTHVFSLLTIGEGLISQIPALIMSLTAGSIVTRVNSGTGDNLGADVVMQISARSEALRIAGVILLGLAAVPGFPTLLFLAFAALIGGMGVLLMRRERRRVLIQGPSTAKLKSIEVPMLLPAPAGARVNVSISARLAELVPVGAIEQRLRFVAHNVAHDLGVPTPNIGFLVNDGMSSSYSIMIDMTPEIERTVGADKIYLPRSKRRALERLNIGYSLCETQHGKPILSVEAFHRDSLAAHFVETMPPWQLLEADVSNVLASNASYFLGIQETRHLIASVEPDYRDLLREVQRVAPVHRMAEIFRWLLDEGIPIRNLRLIFEAIFEWAPREQDTAALAAHVRSAMRRQICFQHADANRVLHVMMVEREAEEVLRGAAKQGQQFIDPAISAQFINGLEQKAASLSEDEAARAVIMVAGDLRRMVWSLLERTDHGFTVLSPQDVAQQFSIKFLATIPLASPRLVATGTRDSQQAHDLASVSG